MQRLYGFVLLALVSLTTPALAVQNLDGSPNGIGVSALLVISVVVGVLVLLVVGFLWSRD